MSLLGAVYGTLMVSYGKTYFSETLPELWLFLMGGLFIVVVMYFPNGIAGLYESHGKQWLAKLFGGLKPGIKPELVAAATKKATPEAKLSSMEVSK